MENWRILLWIFLADIRQIALYFFAAERDEIFTGTVWTEDLSCESHNTHADAIVKYKLFFSPSPHSSAGFRLFEVRGVGVWALSLNEVMQNKNTQLS